MTDVYHFVKKLTEVLAGCDEVLGIGQTGDPNAPLIPGKSDIDLFVICRQVPQKEQREKLYGQLSGLFGSLEMEVCAGGVWGWGDIFLVNGIDVMPMYFPVDEMTAYVEKVLSGNHLEKEGRFYPIGRLASIESLQVLYEKDRSWSRIQDAVKYPPAALFEKWYREEAFQMIDEEDLGRAELRCEVLFFHQVAEAFLDHFLQALYAKNRCYFPSRKRTREAIERFEKKPVNCYARLMNVLALGCRDHTVPQAVAEIRALANELRQLD